MAGNFKVGMTLTAKDESSAVLVKGLKLTTKAATEAEKAAARAGAESKKTSEQSGRSARTASDEARRAAAARSSLGIRSEREIQREIAHTRDSYKELARSGVASARELDKAFRVSKGRVRELRQEMRGYSRAAEAQRIGGNALAITGGVAAAAAMVAQPVNRQMSYDRRLREMSNTAFDGNGQEGRDVGRVKLAASIKTAVMAGGGTKEDAAVALGEMLSSGAVDFETANKWLPDIMKNATASSTSPSEIAQVAIKAKQSFGMKDEDIPAALNMAIAAGKAGNFELKDMARFLPAQMASAKSIGMQGLDDFAKLLALNEVAGITAGSSDEAGNNVVNLLGKIGSADAKSAAKKINVNGHGIDLPGTLVKGREKGYDPIEGFSRLVDKVVGSDKNYQQLQKRLANTKDNDEKTATLESMAAILEGSSIGELIADRQALMGLLAYRNNPEYRKEVETKTNLQRTLQEGQRVGDEDFANIADSNDFKTEQAKNTADFAQMDSMKGLADVVGTTSGYITKFGEEFPGLTTAAAGAATAIESMTAAAVAFAGLKFITGGGKDGGGELAETVDKLKDTAGVAETLGVGVTGVLGAASKIAGPAMAVTSLATFTTEEEDEALENGKERWKHIRAAYPQSTIDAARKKYQPWYQVGEGYSKENEEWIKRYLADEQSSAANASVTPAQVASAAPVGNAQDAMTGATGSATGQPAQGAAVAAPMNVTTQLVVDGQVLAEAVNSYNVQDGNRGTGGIK